MAVPERAIIPDTIVTKIVERRSPSTPGARTARGVLVGRTAEGAEFVQLGSAAQVTFDLDVSERSVRGATTPGNLFRRSGDFLAHGLLEDDFDERSIDEIRSSVVFGGDLIEGEFAIMSDSAKSTITDPKVKAVWAPVELAFGQDWHIVED